MTIQFVAQITTRHNDLTRFREHIGWLSSSIMQHNGWDMVVSCWQSPSPSPNDTQIVHVWNTPCQTAIEARENFNDILSQLDQDKLDATLSTMASSQFIFAEAVDYSENRDVSLLSHNANRL